MEGEDEGYSQTKLAPDTGAEQFESFERINSIRETNQNFDSCNSCKRLVPSRLHELHESKFSLVSRIEFIRLQLSNFSVHVSGINHRLPFLLLTIVFEIGSRVSFKL